MGSCAIQYDGLAKVISASLKAGFENVCVGATDT
jgi:hypothetical protein